MKSYTVTTIEKLSAGDTFYKYDVGPIDFYGSVQKDLFVIIELVKVYKNNKMFTGRMLNISTGKIYYFRPGLIVLYIKLKTHKHDKQQTGKN